ncbi:MAG: TonB-dependent receptor [Pseudomonadota bacterium]
MGAASSLALATASLPATAQADEEKRAEDVIIVKGTKRSLDIQSTTDSIEVFSPERFEDDVVFDLGEVLSRTPNTNLIGNRPGSITIRGIGRGGTDNAGPGNAINFFMDGVPLSGESLAIGGNSLWDVGQVEALRGPQSTIQGRNSIAGAVVVQSKKPTYEWEGAARLRFAENGGRQYAAALSGPIIKNQLAFRLSADQQERDGFITDGIDGGALDFRKVLTLRGRLLFEPDAIDNLSTLLTVEFNQRNNSLNNSGVIADGLDTGFDPNDAISFNPRRQESDADIWKLAADVTYDFNDSISLNILTTYEDTDLDFVARDRFDSAFGTPGSIQFIGREIFSAEARLDFDYGALTGFAGAYYYDFDLLNDADQNVIISRAVPVTTTPSDALASVNAPFTNKIENVAFYTAWLYELGEKWKFDIGLRYDDERFTITSADATASIIPDDALCNGVVLCSILAPALLPPTQPVRSDKFGVILPRGVITYNINDDFSIFAGARRGYRAGGASLASSQDPDEAFRVVIFDPEFLISIEGGWRSQWLDDRLTFNGTLFYSDYQDQQVNFLQDGFTITTNAGETSLYGLEASTDYKVTPDWSLYLSLGLLRTEINEFIFEEDDPTTQADETIDLAGNELDEAPEVTLSVGSSYEHDSGLFGSASLSYSSGYFSDVFNLGPDELGGGRTEKIGSSTMVNASLGYQYKNLKITGFVTNLFEEDEFESVNFAGPGILNGTASLVSQPFTEIRQPRVFGVSLDVQF